MIHALPFPSARTAPVRRTLRLAPPASWSATLAWAAGAVLCLLVALATLPGTAWAKDAWAAPAAAAPAPQAEAPAAPRGKARCTTCGVVESIRELAAVGTQPAAFEFTVRLRDGSARVSEVEGTTASAWLVGDAIVLVGGM